MKSGRPGRNTSGVELANVSPGGFSLRLGDRELFLSFRDFPWFEDATIREIATVELHQPDHLEWPLLDIDLSIESIEHPERFPLVSRVQPARVRERRA